MGSHFDVIIVGAGIAGCAAAKTLADNEFTSILILEAADYVGGRVKTIEAGKIRRPAADVHEYIM